MDIRVEGPDGAVIEFPAGTPRETIQSVMARRYPRQEGSSPPPVVEREVSIPQTPEMGAAPSLTDVPVMELGPGEPRMVIDEFKTQLLREKVAEGGAPSSVRALRGFGDEDDLEAAKKAFDVAGYKNVKVRRIESEGPARGQIVYALPGQPETLFLGPDKLTLGGAAGAVGPSFPAVGGATGGLIGAGAGPVMSIFGAGVGGATAESARRGIGTVLGMQSPTPSEVALGATKAGLWEAATQSMLTVPGRIAKMISGGALPSTRMAEPEIRSAVAEADRRIRDLQAAAGTQETLKPTFGGALASQPRGMPVTAGEQQLATLEGAGDVLRTQRVEGERALERIAGSERMLPGASVAREGEPGYVAPSALGAKVESTAPTQQVFNQALDLLGGPGAAVRRIDPKDPNAGGSLRTAIQTAEETISNATRAGRAQVAADAASATPVIPRATNAAMKNEQDRMKQVLLPKLIDDGDRATINQWFKRDALQPVSYEQLDLTLQAVRAEKRRAREAAFGQSNVSTTMLENIERGLVADRDRMILSLPNGQQVLTNLKNVEQQFAQMKDDFWRSGVRQLIGSSKTAATPVGDLTIGEKILDNPETLRVVTNILNTTPGLSNDKEILKSMVRWSIAKKATPEGAAGVDAEALKSFLEKNRSSLLMLFNQQELRNLGNVGSQIQRVRRVLGVDGMENVGKWFDGFYSAGDAKQAASVFNAARNHDRATGDTLEKTIRGYAANKFLNEFMVEPTAPGLPRTIDSDALARAISDPVRVEWLSNVFGQDFRTRMKLLADAAQIISPASTGAVAGAVAKGGEGELRTARNIVAGQLSREASLITRAINKLVPAIQERAANILVDPQAAFEAIQRGRAISKGMDRAGALAIGIRQLGETALPKEQENQ